MKCPTPETYVHLGKVVPGARFPQDTAKIQANLEAVFKQIEDNLTNPYHLHKGSRPTRDGFEQICQKASVMKPYCAIS